MYNGFLNVTFKEKDIYCHGHTHINNIEEYLEKVKNGMQLVEKANEGKDPIMHIKLNFWDILGATVRYIEEQSGDLKNKANKYNLHILNSF